MVVKKRSKKKTGATRNQQGTSSWSWIVIGLLLVGFVTFLVYLDNIPIEGDNQPESSQTQKKQTVKQKKETKTKPKHQFDFYTVLPDREVKVNNDYAEQPIKKIIPKTPKAKVETSSYRVSNKSGGTSLYQLQVGAFKELSKADAMKARLAFVGVESNIQVIQRNGQKLYRVRVGPSTDEQKINQIKLQLKAKNINTFMQKING